MEDVYAYTLNHTAEYAATLYCHFGTLPGLLAHKAFHTFLEIAFGFGAVETFRIAGSFRTSAVPPYPKQSTQP